MCVWECLFEAFIELFFKNKKSGLDIGGMEKPPVFSYLFCSFMQNGWAPLSALRYYFLSPTYL